MEGIVPPPTFFATTEKLKEHTVCLKNLVEVWEEYVIARKHYADARLTFNYKHGGMNNAEENLTNGNRAIRETYAAYTEAKLTLRETHNGYKASYSGLLQGHNL